MKKLIVIAAVLLTLNSCQYSSMEDIYRDGLDTCHVQLNETLGLSQQILDRESLFSKLVLVDQQILDGYEEKDMKKVQMFNDKRNVLIDSLKSLVKRQQGIR